MKYIVKTSKSVEQAVVDLQAAVVRHNFGVLHIHNLQETLKKKGVEFSNACQILEICNPQSAKEILMIDMALNMALSDSPKLETIAKEVEVVLIAVIDESV